MRLSENDSDANENKEILNTYGNGKRRKVKWVVDDATRLGELTSAIETYGHHTSSILAVLRDGD